MSNRTSLMSMSVEQIKEETDAKRWHFDQSTQRDFLYNNDADYAKSKEDPELSCAGDVIKTILDDGYISPVVLFHTDNMAINEYDVHDGKQRLMSVLEFIAGNVTTKLADGSPVNWNWLLMFRPELAAKILDFKFDIQIRYGTAADEERSFFKTNTAGIPLTEYEGLKGSYHGQYFETFETYLKNKQLIMPDTIKTIGRGEQAIWYLYLALDILDDDKTYTGTDPKVWQLLEKAKSKLALCRTAKFDSKQNRFDDKLNLYCRLIKEGKLHKGDISKQAAKVYRLANYIINNNYDQNLIVNYYAKYNVDSRPNDIGTWKTMKEHKHAIQMLLAGKTPDPLRYFGNWKEFKQAKIDLWTALGSKKVCSGYVEQDGTIHTCGHAFTNIDDTEMDHIISYDHGMEAGGCTVIENCQLICKTCNTAKNKN